MSAYTAEQNALIAARIRDTKGVMGALRQAGRFVIEDSIRSGIPVVVWRDGRTQHIPGEILLKELEEQELALGQL